MSPLHHLLRQHATALLKAGSYYGVHIVVAAAVAYAVTGNWLAALTLSLLEPSVQIVAYFLHDKAWARVPMARYRTLMKTVSYYGVHLVVALLVLLVPLPKPLSVLLLLMSVPALAMPKLPPIPVLAPRSLTRKLFCTWDTPEQLSARSSA